MIKEKSKKNKTIDLKLAEMSDYVNRCVNVGSPVEFETIRNKMILGDAFLVMDYLPPQIVDLLIVDPPYNLSKDYHGNKILKTTEEEYRVFTKRWMEAVKRLLKPTASIYVCSDWTSSLVIGDELTKHFILQNRITWQREKGRGSSNNWKNGLEDIWFATMSKDYGFHVEDVLIRKKVVAPYRENGLPKDWEETPSGNFRNTHPSNFWDDITIPYWSMVENTAHPAQKPEKLLAKLILASSNSGEVVLDPFAGAGSTAVTAKKLGRSFISIEQNPLYCGWAEIRLEQADIDKTIQGYEDGVFWERNTRIAKR